MQKEQGEKRKGRAGGGGAGGRRQGANKTPTNSKSEGGEQRSRKKEQEPSLAAHSEQLKTKHADRTTGKRRSNGRSIAKGGAGGGERRAGQGKGGGGRGWGQGRGAGQRGQTNTKERMLEVILKTPGPVASADITPRVSSLGVLTTWIPVNITSPVFSEAPS